MPKKPDRLKFNQKVRTALAEFLAAADRARANPSVGQSINIEFGLRMIGGHLWLLSKELMENQAILLRECLSVLPASLTSENDLDAAMWDAAATDGSQKNRAEKFFSAIEDEATKPKTYVAPNHAVNLIPPLKHLTIGPVKIVPIGDLKSNTSRLKIRPGTRIDLQYEEEMFFLEFPPLAWEVSLLSSAEHVREEGLWYINIAVSLLRLALIRRGKPKRLFPGPGDVESHAIELRTPHSIGYITKQNQTIAVGGTTILRRYEIDARDVAYFERIKLSSIAEDIFDAPAGSVAEKVKNGLGWMTLARQTKARAERYIYYFTALEALLTSTDQTTPITQTIARSVASILATKNKDRIRLAETVKKLYQKRSALVHAGKRSSIHLSDVTRIQDLTESAYHEVVFRIPLRTSNETFLKGLDQATYGLRWPPH
jgi:Apea-like HEPN